MPKTLLAIDDSATMRKVLEITFVGEDFNVLTASERGGLLAKLTENPAAVVIDTTLGDDDGYAICKEVRQRAPRAAVVLLASRYTPYDAARGRDAGADDYIDKPFDTQQLIDKVKKAIGVREASAPADVSRSVAEAPSRAEAPYRAPAPPIAQAPSPPAPAVSPTATTAARPAFQPGVAPQRSGTLMFAVDGPAVPPAAGAAPAPVAPKPVAPPMAAKAPAAPVVAHAPAPAPAAPAASIAAHTNGQLAPKLAQMGLSQAQIDGVLALSREVIEQVVWEVVPQLAETLIKEEIARLTKE